MPRVGKLSPGAAVRPLTPQERELVAKKQREYIADEKDRLGKNVRAPLRLFLPTDSDFRL